MCWQDRQDRKYQSLSEAKQNKNQVENMFHKEAKFTKNVYALSKEAYVAGNDIYVDTA